MLVICSEPLEPLSLVRCYPIGVIKMKDNGSYDEKIIAIPFNEPNYNMYKSISELPAHLFEEMKHFFVVYKQLEHKDTVVDEIADREEAVRIIAEDIDAYVEKFCK